METGPWQVRFFREARRTLAALRPPTPRRGAGDGPPDAGPVAPSEIDRTTHEVRPAGGVPGEAPFPGRFSSAARTSPAPGVPDPPISPVRAFVQLVLTAVLVPVCLYALFGPGARDGGARDAASAILGAIVAFWLKD